MNILELKQKCKNLNFKGYSTKNKKELLEMIETYEKSQNNDVNNCINAVINNVVLLNPNPEALVIPVINDDTVINESDNNKTILIDLQIENCDGLTFLKTILPNSIDLILTDPPYIISKETGMNTHYDNVKQNEKDGGKNVKSEEEWNDYKIAKGYTTDDKKMNYLKYGTIYGKKYCVKTEYGDWDSEFNLEMLSQFVVEYYKKLRVGGTCIIFFDLWKISYLKEIMEKHKFKQIRFIEWIKTNPPPLNSGVNYLTGSREIALLGVKGGSPTFNSKYDIGSYHFPIPGGKKRFHPTQKSLPLFEELIKKHSNENDVVLDTFLGGGTTALACKNMKRNFKGCELSKEYYDKIMDITMS